MTDPTTQTILSTLLEMKSEQGEMRADVTNTNRMLREHLDADDDTHDDHNRRILSLEDSRKRARWTIGIISFLGSGIFAAAAYAFKHLIGD